MERGKSVDSPGRRQRVGRLLHVILEGLQFPLGFLVPLLQFHRFLGVRFLRFQQVLPQSVQILGQTVLLLDRLLLLLLHHLLIVLLDQQVVGEDFGFFPQKLDLIGHLFVVFQFFRLRLERRELFAQLRTFEAFRWRLGFAPRCKFYLQKLT